MTINEQREYLERNLNNINTVLSAMIGFRTNVEVVENKNYRGNIYYSLSDKTNLKDMCGIMSICYDNVNIKSFNIFWDDEGCDIDFDFDYQLKDKGFNGMHIGYIRVKNNLVTILK